MARWYRMKLSTQDAGTSLTSTTRHRRGRGPQLLSRRPWSMRLRPGSAPRSSGSYGRFADGLTSWRAFLMAAFLSASAAATFRGGGSSSASSTSQAQIGTRSTCHLLIQRVRMSLLSGGRSFIMSSSKGTRRRAARRIACAYGQTYSAASSSEMRTKDFPLPMYPELMMKAGGTSDFLGRLDRSPQPLAQVSSCATCSQSAPTSRSTRMISPTCTEPAISASELGLRRTATAGDWTTM
mmetsp:Transcript_3263/g.9216  ORF Transcript_3263/g.9216 Transcript_3263/m.9216 type:complete len:238 (-) Transcript_3263:481-1194(-)